MNFGDEVFTIYDIQIGEKHPHEGACPGNDDILL
jgi:hypothetical protein